MALWHGGYRNCYATLTTLPICYAPLHVEKYLFVYCSTVPIDKLYLACLRNSQLATLLFLRYNHRWNHMHHSFCIPLYLLAMKSHFVREIFLWFYKLCTLTQISIWETIINVKKIGEHIYTVLDWNSPLLLLAMNLHFYSFIFSRFQNFCLIAQISRTFFVIYASFSIHLIPL